jgi:hypothetical protein
MSGGGAGCACGITGAGDTGAPVMIGFVAIAFALHRRRPRRAQ